MEARQKRGTGQDIAAAMVPDALLTLETVATLVGVKPRTITNWVATNRFPEPVHLSPRLPRWPAAVVQAWLKRQAEAAC